MDMNGSVYFLCRIMSSYSFRGLYIRLFLSLLSTPWWAECSLASYAKSGHADALELNANTTSAHVPRVWEHEHWQSSLLEF